MSQHLEDALQEALDALAAGEPPETVLSRYSDTADDLLPLLVAASAIPRSNASPQPLRQAESKRRFLAMAAHVQVRRPAPGILIRGLAGALVVLALVIAASLASLTALPGEPLYGVKQAVEAARLSLASDQASRARIETDLEQERFKEVRTLLERGDSAAVELVGVWGPVGPGGWSVGGLPVTLAVGVRLPHGLQSGMQVRISGRVENHNLLVTAITVINPQPIVPMPTAPPIPTPAGPLPTATQNPPPTVEPDEEEDEETEEADDGDNSGHDDDDDHDNSGSGSDDSSNDDDD